MKVKSSVIEEVIEIENYKGETVVSIPFRVNLAAAYDDIVSKRREYVASLESNDLEIIGRATIDLFVSVFGEEVTDKLLEYYVDDYTAMITDLTPYFLDIIFPAVETQREKVLAMKKRAKR